MARPQRAYSPEFVVTQASPCPLLQPFTITLFCNMKFLLLVLFTILAVLQASAIQSKGLRSLSVQSQASWFWSKKKATPIPESEDATPQPDESIDESVNESVEESEEAPEIPTEQPTVAPIVVTTAPIIEPATLEPEIVLEEIAEVEEAVPEVAEPNVEASEVESKDEAEEMTIVEETTTPCYTPIPYSEEDDISLIIKENAAKYDEESLNQRKRKSSAIKLTISSTLTLAAILIACFI